METTRASTPFIAEQPLNLDLAVWPGRIGGVDVVYAETTEPGSAWRRRGVADSLYLSVAPVGKTVDGDVATLLRTDRRGWERIWSRTAIRRTAVPACIRTIPGEPIAMPRVPDHEIRLTGVQAMSHDRLHLDPAGKPT